MVVLVCTKSKQTNTEGLLPSILKKQMRINNNNFQKNANTSLVSQLIWKSPGISRVDIARELNLYRSTVTNIISALIDDEVVYEGEEGSGMSRGGRKPIILRLNEKFGCVVGFDIQPSHYRAVILDITGSLLWQQKGALPKVDFDGILLFLMDLVLSEVKKINIPLLAVCAGIPGIVNSDNGIIVYAEPFKLKNYDFHSFFAKRYDVPVFVENDANCTAWLEMTINRNIHLGDFVCLIADYHEGSYQFGDRSGIGVGIALSIGGKVYHGSHHSAGEFCSLSWREESIGQTGLQEDVLIRSVSDPQALAVWMNDLFSSLVPVLSVIDPRFLFIHGKPFDDEDKIQGMLSKDCPQFLALLEKIGCKMVFNAHDESVVAKGAATMYLQKLFAVPELSETESRTHFDWDDVINQAYPMKKSYILQSGSDDNE
ncbi:transcriptional regulator/sugar kinase [Sphaerochaeta pleomorpha str. Grapes]|uniref:Transcriptional regulator/sugar kinase n=2 Tax=Sphaerochaeta TaxID=399320 RepID=G8QR56_SPHPG|nr:transcriptional regulator/sugar kinase [Sphaerochaeta pleomorpha str. Grapes]